MKEKRRERENGGTKGQKGISYRGTAKEENK
jgi:hypothetical protein